MPRKLPLSDVTVVELGHSVAAPYAAEILGDLGANVIKIEKDGGDDARKWAPPYLAGVSAIFQSLNRNKRSAVVNVRDPVQNSKLRRLILDKADVVLQNLRPGTATELGLDGATLCKEKPRLIYCSIGAFGAAGPLKDRPGYDPLMQAFAGLMSVTGEPGQNPVRVGTSIIDMAAGMWSVIGILSALAQRAETNRGGVVETSLYETALAWMSYHVANFQASGELPERQGSGAGQIVPYRGYSTSDGFIVIGAANDKLFALLSKALEHPEWIEDPRFRTNPDRVENKAVLYGMIEQTICGRTSAEWQMRMDEMGIPCAVAQTVEQVLNHEQTKKLGILQTSPDGALSLIGLPLSFDGERPPFRLSPPALGAHTNEIFETPATSGGKQ